MTIEKTRKIHRGGVLTALVVSALFILYISIIAGDLTFFWDDYETLHVISQDPFSQLFMSGAGHYGPLWRLIFTIQVFIFGTWFPGYVAVNAAFGVAGYWLLFGTLRSFIHIPLWQGLVGAGILFTGIGPLAQILIAVGSEWTSACFFGALAAYLYTKGARTWIWSASLMASALCLNGTFPVYVVLFLGVVLARQQQLFPTSSWKERVLRARYFFLWIVVAGVWVIAGFVLGSVNATPYYDVGEIESLGQLVPTPPSPWQIIATTFSLGLSWTAAPVIPTILASELGVTTLTIAVSQYLVIVLIILLLLVFGALLWLSRHSGLSGIAERATIPLIVIMPLLAWALVIAAARSDTVHITRYATIWLPFASLFWVVVAVVFRQGERTVSRIIGISITGLLTLCAVAGAFLLPSTIRDAANLDRDRLQWSREQALLWDACLVSDQVRLVDEVSPLLDTDIFCGIRRYLEETSLYDQIVD